jgi:uncharacterized membrane protein YtjA (UPF0391 family)
VTWTAAKLLVAVALVFMVLAVIATLADWSGTTAAALPRLAFVFFFASLLVP